VGRIDWRIKSHTHWVPLRVLAPSTGSGLAPKVSKKQRLTTLKDVEKHGPDFRYCIRRASRIEVVS
jgi:hypothetical protein